MNDERSMAAIVFCLCVSVAILGGIFGFNVGWMQGRSNVIDQCIERKEFRTWVWGDTYECKAKEDKRGHR